MNNKKQDLINDSQTHPDHPYFIDGQYPQEDKHNEMFAPVWRRGGTWLGLVAFLLLLLVAVFFEPDVGKQTELDPQVLSIGLGIFACIAFLWLTEAMPLAATALLVPVLGTIFNRH